MNQLRIIDHSTTDAPRDQVEIQLIGQGVACKQRVAYFPSPFDANFREELNWYYAEFLLNPYGARRKRAQRVADKIVMVGKTMGERLFGQSKTNNGIHSDILQKLSEIDLASLTVTVESKRDAFFQEPWEMLILPGSGVCLAAACAGFFRKPASSQSIQSIRLQTSKISPLRILMVVARPQTAGRISFKTKSLEIINHIFGYDPAFKVEILSPPSFEMLQKRFADRENPIHIVHFDGPLQSENGISCLVFEDQQALADCRPAAAFAGLLASNGVRIVFLDYCAPAVKGEIDCPLQAALPLELVRDGVPSVITTTQTTYTFCTIQIYQIIYSQIAQGFSLAKALVAAREYMRRNVEQNALTAQRQDFIDWLLPVHYGDSDIELFDEKQEGVPFVQAERFGQIMTRLTGFTPELLPPYEFWGRDRQLHEIRKQLQEKRAVAITGVAGIGKTHLMHRASYWLVLSGQFEKASYFSGARLKSQYFNLFDPIGNPASQSPEEQPKRKRLIVVDDLFGDEIETNDCLKANLKSLLKEAAAGGTGFLIGGGGIERTNIFSDFHTIALSPLSLEARRQLGVRCLQQNHLDDEEGDPHYLKLLDALGGHAYLTDTLLKRFAKTPADEVLAEYLQAAEIASRTDVKTSGAIVDEPLFGLFEPAWKKLCPAHQRIFAALADLSGFITDALPIAFDMKDQATGQEFFDALEVERPGAMNEVLEKGVVAGFFRPKPFGRDIQSLVPGYLRQKREAMGWSREKTDQLDLLLKKIFCLELKVLLAFIAHNANPLLLNKIAENRERWFESLSRLWRAKEALFFTQSKYLFQKLLEQMGLADEFSRWAFALVAESDYTALDPVSDPDFSTAWLNLAGDAVHCEAFQTSAFAAKWVNHWEEWMQSPENCQLSVFNHALMFLETWYRRQGDWPARKRVSLTGLQCYTRQDDYQGIIKALKSLSRCEEALGNSLACDQYESRLLNDIPYDRLEQGLQQHTLLEVVSWKINRKDFDGAQQLLNRLADLPKVGELPQVAAMFQGDIHFNTGKTEAAAAIYCELWAGFVKKEHRINPDKISKMLTTFEAGLGPERFSQIFREKAPGIEKPFAMADKKPG